MYIIVTYIALAALGLGLIVGLSNEPDSMGRFWPTWLAPVLTGFGGALLMLNGLLALAAE